MSCKICGNDGHNSRTCSQLPPVPASSSSNTSDHALWLRYGGLTKDQAKQLRHGVENLIEQIAPDSYGVIAAGKASKLPERIQQALQAQQENVRKLEDK